MMEIHPREEIVETAERDIRNFITRTFIEKKLTEGEQIAVLSTVISEKLGLKAKYMIRMERHGNYDTPGGQA